MGVGITMNFLSKFFFFKLNQNKCTRFTFVVHKTILLYSINHTQQKKNVMKILFTTQVRVQETNNFMYVGIYFYLQYTYIQFMCNIFRFCARVTYVEFTQKKKNVFYMSPPPFKQNLCDTEKHKIQTSCRVTTYS